MNENKNKENEIKNLKGKILILLICFNKSIL